MRTYGMVRVGQPTRFNHMNEDTPLYPEHGAPYYAAMAEAIEEYEAMIEGRKLNKGIRIYSRKELDREE